MADDDWLSQDPHLARGVAMVRDWWRLHPEDDPDALDIDVLDTGAYRARLYESINAASDGELETLFAAPNGPGWSMSWAAVVGIAASPVGT